MGIGKLKYRLDLQRQGGNRWEKVCECRCRITYLRGGEKIVADRVEGANIAVVRVRASSVMRTADTSMRFKMVATGEVFEIRSKIPAEDRRWIDFTCLAKVN